MWSMVPPYPIISEIVFAVSGALIPRLAARP